MKKELNIIFFVIFYSILFSQEIEKDKIVIMNFKAANIDQQIADAVLENFTTSVINFNIYQVVERAQIDKIISELKLGANEEFDETIAIKIGKLAKAKFILIGSVTKLGKSITINIRKIEVETGVAVLADSITTNKEDELIEAVKILAKRLLFEKNENIENQNDIITEKDFEIDEHFLKENKIIKRIPLNLNKDFYAWEGIKPRFIKKRVNIIKNEIFINNKMIEWQYNLSIEEINKKLKPEIILGITIPTSVEIFQEYLSENYRIGFYIILNSLEKIKGKEYYILIENKFFHAEESIFLKDTDSKFFFLPLKNIKKKIEPGLINLKINIARLFNFILREELNLIKEEYKGALIIKEIGILIFNKKTINY